MIQYLPSYDIETVRCLEGVRSIAAHHIHFGIPATFFVVGELLEDQHWAEELARILDNDLFSIQNHTYSHLKLQFGTEVTKEFLFLLDEELSKTNSLIEKTFKHTPTGFRSPMGFPDGLKGEDQILKVLWNNGIRYVSSKAVGRHGTIPASLSDSFYYDEEDILHPLLEIPVHGWHDNVLKGYNYCPMLWPPLYTWSAILTPPETPQDEFLIYRKWFEEAEKMKLSHFGPIFHPWAVYRFNQKAETIALLLNYIQEKGIQTNTYEGFNEFTRKNKPI